MWIGERVFDHPLDAEIFGVHGADNSQPLGFAFGNALCQRFTVKCADGNGSAVAYDEVSTS